MTCDFSSRENWNKSKLKAAKNDEITAAKSGLADPKRFASKRAVKKASGIIAVPAKIEKNLAIKKGIS